MISFTYCVSRYNDKTALSVFVSLHISHPAVRWPLMRDKGLSTGPRRFIPEHDARRAVVACRAESYTRKSTSTSMAWRCAGNSEGPQRSLRLHLQRHRQARISRGLGPRNRAPPSWRTPGDGQRLVAWRCGPQGPIEGDTGHPDLQRTAVERPADDRLDCSPPRWRLRRAESSRVGRQSPLPRLPGHGVFLTKLLP